jgi:uncharacterized protein
MKTHKRRYLLVLGCLLLLAAIAWLVRVKPGDRPASLPYEVEQVGFENAKGGLRLAGTLNLPPTPGPHPAIVLIPGSGEVDRDGAVLGHRFYFVLADYLTRRGFAVLRSDKRGLGESGGEYASATTFDFASDAEAALAFLRRRPDIDRHRIGLVGHSEGGLVGTILAGRDPGIAFLVLMAGNGIPASEMFLARTRLQMPPNAGRDSVEKELALQRAVFSAVTAPGSEHDRTAAVRKLYLAARTEYGRAFSDEEFAPFLTPWMRTLLTIDPRPLLRQVRCPVLALVGDKDRVVTAQENVPALEQALAGNPQAQVHRLPGLNHFFQTADTGEFSEVASIEETMSPRALALIGEWAAQQHLRK